MHGIMDALGMSDCVKTKLHVSRMGNFNFWLLLQVIAPNCQSIYTQHLYSVLLLFRVAILIYWENFKVELLLLCRCRIDRLYASGHAIRLTKGVGNMAMVFKSSRMHMLACAEQSILLLVILCIHSFNQQCTFFPLCFHWQ